jgi:putative phage-type endonuclease
VESVNLVQGSEEWHQHRATHLNASDAPAMMNASAYKTRNDLLHEKATGETPEIDEATQKRFDLGHQYEAMARAIIENQKGEDLFPVVGELEVEGLPLSASLDGIDMLETFCFEHKMINQKLAATTSIEELDDQYKIQMEQQLLVSGCDMCLFVASNGTEDGMVLLQYTTDPVLRQKIISGWHQFQADLKSYTPPEFVGRPEPKAIMDLPTLSIVIKGEVSSSNLVAYQEGALAFIQSIKTDLATDQDFADAEKTVKFCDKAEKELESVKKQALGQTADIETLFRTVDHLKEELRQKRLTLSKAVKSEKDRIKKELISGGHSALADHVSDLQSELGEFHLPAIDCDLKGAIKGKRTISSLHNAIDTEVAQSKIIANEVAATMRQNILVLNEAIDHRFLFNDAQQLVTHDTEHFSLIVSQRIADHKKAEEERKAQQKAADEAEAVRRRIREEEHARVQAELTKRAAERIEPEQKSEPAVVEPKAAVEPEATQPIDLFQKPTNDDLSVISGWLKFTEDRSATSEEAIQWSVMQTVKWIKSKPEYQSQEKAA